MRGSENWNCKCSPLSLRQLEIGGRWSEAACVVFSMLFEPDTGGERNWGLRLMR